MPPKDSAPILAAPPAMSSSVRRLTPQECEMLKGWPPGWTIVHDWKARKEK